MTPIGYLLKRGDAVKVTIPTERREFGYNPCPNGTVATVIGPYERVISRIDYSGLMPGVYENPAWFHLLLPNGAKLAAQFTWLEFTDNGLLEAREREWIAAGRPEDIRLRDLPDTAFWEDDIVCLPGRPRPQPANKDDPRVNGDPCHYVVTEVLYDIPAQDEPFPQEYRVSFALGANWNQSIVAEADATLVERGRIWKRVHDETVVFGSLAEEVDFAVRARQFSEIPNPNGGYGWPIGDAIEAVRTGTAHGTLPSSQFVSLRPEHTPNEVRAIWFRDEDLGRRVAAATLEGFAEQ